MQDSLEPSEGHLPRDRSIHISKLYSRTNTTGTYKERLSKNQQWLFKASRSAVAIAIHGFHAKPYPCIDTNSPRSPERAIDCDPRTPPHLLRRSAVFSSIFSRCNNVPVTCRHSATQV
eukprot:scaffold772_cov339-Pavlova_lutheri.AAC.88